LLTYTKHHIHSTVTQRVAAQPTSAQIYSISENNKQCCCHRGKSMSSRILKT